MGWSIYMVVDGLNSTRYLQRQLTNLISTICNIKVISSKAHWHQCSKFVAIQNLQMKGIEIKIQFLNQLDGRYV